jgi:hypothetical protein
VTWFADQDGDGFGDPDIAHVSCAAPAGFVASNTDCDDTDATVYPSRPRCPIQTEFASCLEIVNAGAARGDGAYEVRIGGVPQTVWCDMTTDGGGWMALINPEVMPATMGAGAVFAGSTQGGTTNSCTSPPSEFVHGAWRGLVYLVCGDVDGALQITWPELASATPVSFTDVMFAAVVQGQTQQVTVNGIAVPPSGSTVDEAGAICGFWNASQATAMPAADACATTFLDAAPLILTGTAPSHALMVSLTTGPACAPTCDYGVGMNIQQLLVR